MKALHRHVQNQSELEREVQAHFEVKFEDVMEVHRIEWTDFRDAFLYPLVSELGAHAYEFLSGESIEVGEAESHLRFLSSVPVALRGRISDRITAFLDAQNQAVRSYMLRLLNAAFLVQATHLTDKTLAFVEKTIGQKLRLNVFVDTNFLFSLIGIHANPADDVVAALHHMIAQLKGRLDVKLYVLPVTVDEAKNAIAGYEKRLSRLSLTKEMSQALKGNPHDLSGVTLKFVEDANRTGGRLSAEDYFAPYQKNFLAIVRSKGVELYNASTEPLGVDQAVVDDILDQIAFEEARYPEHRRKSYAKIRHDMVLWHFTRRKRPVRLESPIDAEFWAATIDFRLLRFDRYKRRRIASEPPVCIHPTILLQILQLWVPRDALLEAALVSSLQPLLPQDFDRDAEEVTIRILKSLARFANSEALGRETVARIMVDEAVRSRIEGAKNADEEFEVVRDALSQENQLLNTRVSELEETTRELSSMIDARDSAARAIGEQLERDGSERRQLQRDLEGEKERIREEEGRRVEIERQYYRQRAMVCVVGIGIGGMAVFGVLGWLCLRMFNLPAGIVATISILIAIGGGLSCASVMTVRRKNFLEPLLWPKWLRNLTGAYLTAVVLGLAVHFLGSWLWGLLSVSK